VDSKLIVGIIIALVVIVGAYMVFASGSSSNSQITVAGSTSVQPVAEKLAQAYMQKNPNVKINVQGGGSGVGIKSVSEGTVDIGTSSKDLNANESVGLNQTVIGKDGIVVAVNTANSVLTQLDLYPWQTWTALLRQLQLMVLHLQNRQFQMDHTNSRGRSFSLPRASQKVRSRTS